MADQNMIDLTNLEDDLEEASRLSGQSVHQIMLGFASEIQADMQQRAHVVTGKMRANITIKDEPSGITVGVDDAVVPYAKYEAYGTKPHIIRAKNKKALMFKVGGKTVIVKSVHHPGQPAHDFVTPAIEDFIHKLGPAASDVGVTLIMGNR
jgi:HK97 gp10 family phage protein